MCGNGKEPLILRDISHGDRIMIEASFPLLYSVLVIPRMPPLLL